jgi:hypothetical protein
MMRRILAWGALVTALFCCGPARAGSLRAGAARLDITPSQPVTLAGYEARKDLSRGVHDPLFARALVFEQDDNKLALVSIESLGFYNKTAEPLRQAILSACGLKPSELLLCAIHTHSAPTLTLDPERGHSNNVEYTRSLETKLAEVVHNALQRLAPVRIQVGSGSSPIGVNRREVVTEPAGTSKIILGRNPSRLTDREVQVLRVVPPEDDHPLAVLFAYSTHSTSLGTKNYLISGDVHGLAAQFLERQLGAGVVTPEFAGASGDIDPWYRVLPGFNTTNGWVPEPILMGTMLGEEVDHVLDTMRGALTNTAIKSASKTVELPGKPGGEDDSNNATKPFNITAGAIGDIAFVGLGGEVFNELGRAIKDGSPFRSTFVFTHCNGAGGYVPTRPSYAEGGYEVQSSPYAPGAGELLVEETGRLLKQLKAQ